MDVGRKLETKGPGKDMKNERGRKMNVRQK